MSLLLTLPLTLMFKLNFPTTANVFAYWLSLLFIKLKKLSTTFGNLLLLMLKLKKAWSTNSPVVASMEYANKPLNALTPGISYKIYYDIYSKHLVNLFGLVRQATTRVDTAFPFSFTKNKVLWTKYSVCWSLWEWHLQIAVQEELEDTKSYTDEK